MIDLNKIPEDKQKEDLCLEAVMQNISMLEYVKNQTPELCIAAMNKNPHAFIYVKNQTQELCAIAIKLNALNLKYVKKQTPELCLSAVSQNGQALQYVKNQTPEICLSAINTDWTLLRHVKVQTPEICAAAVKLSPYALKYMKNQTEEVCLTAVKKDGLALRHVKDKTINVCTAAIEQRSMAIIHSKFLYDHLFIKSFSRLDNRRFGIIDLNYIISSHLYNSKNKNKHFIIDKLKKTLKDSKKLEEFKDNPLKFVAELISGESLEYISDLKDKSGEDFKNNEYLMAVYEKAVLNESIAKQSEKLPSISKKF